MRLFPFVRAIFPLVVLSVVAWGWGFAHFVKQIQAIHAADYARPEKVDAIVVLTGGRERLSTGFDLLEAGMGKQLFVSGVHRGLTIEDVPGSEKLGDVLRACCVTLGHAAESTEGNAQETQQWMERHTYRSMLLVTAHYHMPRSMLLFRARLPGMTIIPHPVAPESVMIDTWWEHAGTAHLLMTEYDKYLFARFTLWVASL